MFFNFKYIILISLMISSIYSYESNNDANVKTTDKKYYDQGDGVNKNHLMQAYNAPARVNLLGKYDLFIEGNFIWWQPKEKGLTIGNDLDSTNNLNKVLNFQADYMIGFKAAIGGHHNFDDWTFLLLYTWFNKNSNNSIKKNESFHSEWIETNVSEIFAKWDLKFNLFEIELSRTNLTGKNVVFSPYFTINGGFIDQNYIIKSSTYNSFVSSDSWLIGPKVGIKTSWNMKSNIKLITNISGSLFFQNYTKIKYEIKNNTTSLFTRRVQMKLSNLTPNLNFNSGLSYENNFLQRNHVTVQIMYEFLHFWNQNQMRYLLNELRYTRFDAGSLMLHGLTASLRWDF